MNKLNAIYSLGGRVLIALIFVLAGLNKIGSIEGTQGYMEAMGVPGILIYPTILFEVGAGLAIMLPNAYRRLGTGRLLSHDRVHLS
jgi:putative oxidoreductase